MRRIQTAQRAVLTRTDNSRTTSDGIRKHGLPHTVQQLNNQRVTKMRPFITRKAAFYLMKGRILEGNQRHLTVKKTEKHLRIK
jgi:hypothetical protein